MKYISVLIFQFFCLTAPSQSTRNFLKTVPPHSQRVVLGQRQGLPTKHLNIPPRLSIFWKFFPKFFYWKHSMELDCFKDVCAQAQYGDYSDKTGQKKISFSIDNTHDQNLHEVKEARYQTIRQYPAKERIIFWSPEIVSLKRQPNQQSSKQNVISSTKAQLNLNNHKNSFDIQISNTTERNEVVENFKLSPEKDHHRKAVPENDILLNFFKKPYLEEPSTENSRSNIAPYEVEEIIEEKYETEINDEDGEFLEKETTRDDFNKKTDYKNIMENSIKSILSKLLSSGKKEELFEEKNDVLLRSEERGKWTTDSLKKFAEGRHKTEKNVFVDIFNRIPRPTTQQKEIYGNWRHKSTERTQIFEKKLFKPEINTRMNNSRRIDFTPSFQNILPSDSYETDLPTLPVFPNLSATKNSEIPSTGTSNSIHLLTTTTTRNFPDFATENRNRGTTETEKTTTEKPLHTTTRVFLSDSPDDISETNFSTEYTTARETTTDEAEVFPTTEEIREAIENDSESYISDEEMTKKYTEFSDRPMSIDLLSTTVKSELKKDSEGGSKNSRKMHFENSREPTISNEIFSAIDMEQRRSDILIADSIADYIDEENEVPYSLYIENLKRNDSFLADDSKNLKIDALIPLVSRVINDLREGKIPAEDFPILSEALGKYWKPISTLSNVPNLDVLPLLKMKTEEDLKNYLDNFLPEETTTSKTTDSDSKGNEYYGEIYDYMDHYKDMYKDVPSHEGDTRRRRLRPKRDTDKDTDYQKMLEARREYFESLEEEKNNDENHYIFEDIIYDEMFDDDYSVFEPKKMTNVEIDPET